MFQGSLAGKWSNISRTPPYFLYSFTNRLCPFWAGLLILSHIGLIFMEAISYISRLLFSLCSSIYSWSLNVVAAAKGKYLRILSLYKIYYVTIGQGKFFPIKKLLFTLHQISFKYCFSELNSILLHVGDELCPCPKIIPAYF